MHIWGRNILYIGIANHQNVSDEVKKTINRFDENPHGLQICLGYITRTTYGRITNQIIMDVECALINALQPSHNTQCKSSYKGRTGLTIYNSGCIQETVRK